MLFFWHYVDNKILTTLSKSNIFTNLNLSDMETNYKMFRSEIIKKIGIESNRFGFEPEITAKITKKGAVFMKYPYHIGAGNTALFLLVSMN